MLRQRDICQDAGEQVIEVMGNAAGKNAYRFDLAGPQHVFFRLFTCANINERNHQRHAQSPAHWGDHTLKLYLATIFT